MDCQTWALHLSSHTPSPDGDWWDIYNEAIAELIDVRLAHDEEQRPTCT